MKGRERIRVRVRWQGSVVRERGERVRESPENRLRGLRKGKGL